jgi:NADPH-dependent 2,4-dienoyl-CoA reductase/sulfur reductase-like enzyme
LRYAVETSAAALVSSIEYLVGELALLGIKVQSGVVADERLLARLAPDEVILATGGRPAPADAFPGASDAGAMDTVDALAGAEIGGSVLVYDTVGANEGALAAEALALRGHQVHFVTPWETVMPNGGQLHRVQLPETLLRRMKNVVTSGLIGLVDNGVAIVVRANGDTLAEIAADTIVAVTPGKPNIELVPVLERLAIRYQIVGDALSPRWAMQAFKEGHQAALAV